MTKNAYLGDPDLEPGTEIFRTERHFRLWAYTPSHHQTLLRGLKGEAFGTRVDVLFAYVKAMKIRTSYGGLVIRVATPAEATAIRVGLPSAHFADNSRVLLLDSGGETDYIIASIVGWHEDTRGWEEPSFFAGHAPDTPQWARTPLFGVDGGLGGNVATPQQLIRALLDETPVPDRDRYRSVYVVMRQAPPVGDGPRIRPAGVFLSKDEAEKAATRLTTKVRSCWIQAVPIAV